MSACTGYRHGCGCPACMAKTKRAMDINLWLWGLVLLAALVKVVVLVAIAL